MGLTKNSNEQSQCKSREIISISYHSLKARFGDITTVPLKEEILALTGASTVLWTYLTRQTGNVAQTTMHCSDYPIKKIIAITGRKLKDVIRSKVKQDISLQAAMKITSTLLEDLETFRYSMFQHHASLFEDHHHSKKKGKHVENIKKFVRFFENSQQKLKTLNREDYIAEMEKSPNLLSKIGKALSSSAEDSLLPTLLSIAKFQLAIPKNKRDKTAFHSLSALIYGTQTCVSAMLFLLDQYAYLANSYYLDGDMDGYNSNYEKLMSKFKTFKISLIGSFVMTNVEPLLPLVLQTMEDVYTNLDFYLEKTTSSKTIHSSLLVLGNNIGHIDKIMDIIRKMTIPVIDATPKTAIHFSFKTSIPTPIGKWESDKTVTYALQYKKQDSLSKVGEWSKPLKILDKACPRLSMPVDPERRQRLIFRKFNDDERAEFIGILDHSETEFLDVHRDFYDAVKLDSPKDLEVAGVLATAGADVQMKFEMGQAALHAAAIAGKKEFATRFILSKDDVLIDLGNDNRYTALHIATESGQEDFVELLIEHKANSNLKTASMGFTPLHLASRKGSTNSIKILLNNTDTDINEKDKSGFSALHHAVLGSNEAVELLISKEDIDASVRSLTGLTPFHIAALNSEIAVAKSLINSQKVQINEGDFFGVVPLHYVVMLGHEEMVKYILSLDGVDVNKKEDVHQWNALHFAITFKRENIIPLLLNSSDIDVNAKTTEHATPLHYAVTFKMKKTVEELLAKSADTEVMTVEGYTPLHLAAMLEDSDILNLLLNHNANINAVANDETPLEIAKKLGRENNVSLLLEKGAKENSKRLADKRSVLNENYNEFMVSDNRKYENIYRSYLQNEYANSTTQLTSVKSNISKSYLTIPKQSNLKTKKIDSTKFADTKQNFNVTAKFDVLSTLLLLNVLIRKFTNQKFIDNSYRMQSKLDYETDTLKLDKTFETLLDNFNVISPNKLSNMEEAFANIHKNIKNGSEDELRKILCSNIQNFNSLNSQYWQTLGDTYMNTDSYNKRLTVFTDGNEINTVIMDFISDACPLKT